MKKLTKILTLLLFVAIATSCKNEKSLQQYLVNISEKEGFISGDLPIGSLLSAKADISNEVKETIKSIKKVNVAFLQKTSDNNAAYETEKATLKNIFSSKDFKSLGSVKAKGMNLKVYYTGEAESIDEVIAFGYSKEKGVGVARLLGENMNPAKIIEMLNNVNIDDESSSLKQFAKMFNKK